MPGYIIRLDDACEKRDMARWTRMEKLLDQYGIRPLVGVIPDCRDVKMEAYPSDPDFWDRVQSWIRKGWVIAMHGDTHVYVTQEGGINPVNRKSEFAGLPLEVQKQKIRHGVEILRSHGIDPQVFFAPSHTFDENTVLALKEESSIRIISDTVANRPYSRFGMTFVPQQSGSVRRLPFHTVTFCCHPNTMKDSDYEKLENFLKQYQKKFTSFPLQKVLRKENSADKLLSWMYFAGRKIRSW